MVKLELPHGTFEGEVLDGKASGKGKLIYKNGSKLLDLLLFSELDICDKRNPVYNPLIIEIP